VSGDTKSPRKSSRRPLEEDLRRHRAYLLEQIRLSQETIVRSKELIKRLDEMLGEPKQKP
jgi:hypothetical protein